jgi:RNA polymerase sigma factor (sigma-70 family)
VGDDDRPTPTDDLPEQPTHDRTITDRDPELWGAVRALPPKQRAAVSMRYAADLGYTEIAAALECSEDAARRSVHEGLKRLRSERVGE